MKVGMDAKSMYPSLRMHIRKAGLSEMRFAWTIGLTQPDFSMRMIGKRAWRLEEAKRAADALHLTIDEAFFSKAGQEAAE